MDNSESLAFIPSAGAGTRLSPITNYYAKPAIPLGYSAQGTEYLIGYALGAVEPYCSDQIITTHHLSGTIDKAVCRYSGGMKSRPNIVSDNGLIHFGGSIVLHQDLIRAHPAKSLIIIPGDSFVNAEAIGLAKDTFLDQEPDVTIISTKKLDGHNIYSVDSGNRLLHSVPSDFDAPKLANLGGYIVNKQWLMERVEGLERGKYYDFRTDILFPDEDNNLPVVNFAVIDDTSAVMQDIGTLQALHAHIIKSPACDSYNGNLIFAGAYISKMCAIRSTVVYPGSYVAGKASLEDAIVCPGAYVDVSSKPTVTSDGIMVYSSYEMDNK